jgi:hypothetical protein
VTWLLLVLTGESSTTTYWWQASYRMSGKGRIDTQLRAQRNDDEIAFGPRPFVFLFAI